VVTVLSIISEKWKNDMKRAYVWHLCGICSIFTKEGKCGLFQSGRIYVKLMMVNFRNLLIQKVSYEQKILQPCIETFSIHSSNTLMTVNSFI